MRQEKAAPKCSGPGPLVTALATLTGNLGLLVLSVLMGLVAILTSWMSPRGIVFHHVARLWSRGVLAASGVRLEAHYHRDIGRHDNYIFLANHQSLFDIPVLLATVPVPTRFLAKRSLFRLPIFGWSLRAGGFIPVDRQDRSRAREIFSTALERLSGGASVLVFPEETRSPDGRLLPFKSGGFLLALKSGVVIVPVGIRGTLAVRHKGSFVIRPGVVRVQFGQPLPVRDFGPRRKRELMAEVRRRIAHLAGIEGPEPAAEEGLG